MEFLSTSKFIIIETWMIQIIHQIVATFVNVMHKGFSN